MPEKIIKKEDKERGVAVFKETPTQPIKEYETEDKVYDVFTNEEALTELLEKVRVIYKVVVGNK